MTTTTETTIDMDRVVELVREAGFAAYVEQTGGGVQTIYASREWEERAITRMGEPAGTVRFPKTIDDDGHYEAAAGPGSIDGDRALGWVGDFWIGPDDDGESDPDGEATSTEDAAERLIALLRKSAG